MDVKPQHNQQPMVPIKVNNIVIFYDIKKPIINFILHDVNHRNSCVVIIHLLVSLSPFKKVIMVDGGL